MKRFLITTVVLVCLAACKSVMFNDLNVQMPNANLLPPLKAAVDKTSIKDSFDAKYVGMSSSAGYQSSEGWGGGSSGFAVVRKRDRLTRDMITLFNRNVDNISQQYGERKGTIKMRFTNSNIYDSGYYYAVPSTLSLYTLNLLGFPYIYKNTDLEVEISIYTKKDDLIWKTTVIGHGEEVVALYYGYDEEGANTMSTILALKDALRQANMNIANDFQVIKKGLQ